MRGELGRSTTLIVFFICVHLFLNSTNGRLPYTSFELDFMNRIVFMKKGNDGKALSRRYETHSGGKKERSWLK